MGSISEEGGSPYNLRGKGQNKGPSPRKPIRHNDLNKGSDNELSASEDETVNSTTTSRNTRSSPGAGNVSKLSRDGSSSPQKIRKPYSTADSPQSFKGSSCDSSFSTSPSPRKRTDNISAHSTQKASTGTNQEKSQSKQFFLIPVAIICVVVLFGIFCVNPSSSINTIRASFDPVEDTRISFEHFQDRFKELRMRFPGQDQTFWRTVFGLLRPMVVEVNPASPAVFMMVVPKNQHGESRTAECLARQLLTLYSGLFNQSLGSHGSHIHILQDLGHKSPAEDKKELDNKLLHVFGQSQGKGVILDNFESLTPFAALLLHGYCDGDNAPYKDVLFIQIVHTDSEPGEITSQKNYMDKYLKELWISDLDEDKIQPLLTRIANNVAMVTPEKEHTLQQNC